MINLIESTGSVMTTVKNFSKISFINYLLIVYPECYFIYKRLPT